MNSAEYTQIELSIKFGMPLDGFEDKCMFINFATAESDKLVYEWFVRKRSKNLIISGNMIRTMALKIGKRLKKPNFRPSNGWFSCFQKRHNIRSRVISGEAGLVNTEHTFYQIVIYLVENNAKITDEFPAYDENDYSDDEFIDYLILPIEEDTNHKDSFDYSTCSEIESLTLYLELKL
ncbi:hypothetical protein A3Q56_01395 [Intoshia linei]|uniref:HTH CENPB-type domain-containing protein n=1 Tax=Intoshia linei TaxID=1819745 RepID=A0A177B8W9_9BILA|nr:hypothetical protein A3Q56_01395 [Intoshia linei]